MSLLELLLDLDTLKKLPVDILKIVNGYDSRCTDGYCLENRIFQCKSCSAPYCEYHLAQCDHCDKLACLGCLGGCCSESDTLFCESCVDESASGCEYCDDDVYKERINSDGPSVYEEYERARKRRKK